MNDNFSASLQLSKPIVRSNRGVVAAQHRRAAEIGARILARGGDAVDAAIATSFALGVLEPWMSGLGGGGAMVLYRAAERRYRVIDFGMRAPAALSRADFPLSGRGKAGDLFPWAHVVGDRNVHGALAVAVPGQVDGMRLAFEAYARLPWAELLAPAIACADDGLLIDWYATESISSAAADLARYAASRALFLRDGLPPVAAWSARTEVRLPQTALAQSLRHLAQHGARDFYEGELARRWLGELDAAGAKLAASDLAAYRARATDPALADYRGARVAVTPELTGGPTLLRCLSLLRDTLQSAARPDATVFAAYARALQQAYSERLQLMGDIDGARAPACTSHFCVVDAAGNVAAVTQTLLSIFGSRLTLGDTGFVLNNGIMCFDPEADRPNSLAPGKRCLTNYCPVVFEMGERRVALGASGGRRILPAVLQLLSFCVDFGMSLEQAFHAPRIDASEGDLLIGDVGLDAATHDLLAREFDYVRARRFALPLKFACPSAAEWQTGAIFAATEIGSPWADAAAA